MNILQKILNSGQKIIIDGGTGTELAKLGADTSDSGNWVALSHMTNPELITKIHQNFVHAGADVIIANTYATNKLTFRADLPKVNEILENSNYRSRNITTQDDIITEGVRIAKNAVKNMISRKGNKILVAASISAHSPGCHRDKITGKWVGDWPEDLEEFLKLYTETVEALLKGEPDLLFIEMSRGVNPACDLISRAIGQVYERKQKEMMNTSKQNLPPVFIGFSTRLTYSTLSLLNNKNEKILTQKECESLSSLPMRYIEQTKNLTNENLCYWGDASDSGEHFKSFTAEEIKRHFDLLGFIPAGINIMHTKPEAIFESLKVVDEVKKSLHVNGTNLMVGIYQDNQEFINPRSIFYQVDKAVLKKYMDDWEEFGFDLIGGCCGTDCEFLEIVQQILESSSVLH